MPGKQHSVKFPNTPPKEGAGTIDKGQPSKGASRGNIEDFNMGSTQAWPDKAQGRIPKAI